MMILFGVMISSVSFAAKRAPASARDSEPQSTMEFDEKVVEALNRRDLSSASMTGENRLKRGERLIREKTEFRDELQKSLRELKWVR